MQAPPLRVSNAYAMSSLKRMCYKSALTFTLPVLSLECEYCVFGFIAMTMNTAQFNYKYNLWQYCERCLSAVQACINQISPRGALKVCKNIYEMQWNVVQSRYEYCSSL